MVSNLWVFFFFRSIFWFSVLFPAAWVFGRRRLGGNHPVDIISDMTFFYFLAKFFNISPSFFFYCLVVIVTKKVGLFFFLGCWLWDDTNSSFSTAVFPGSFFSKSSERQMILLHNSSSSSAHHRNKLRCNSLHVRHQADPLCTLQLVERGNKPGNRKFSFRYQ